MADRGKKDSTPPPLLLMPAGGGLTLTPPDQPNVLMPVIQSEPSLIDEDGEADSFVGQGPPASGAPFGAPPMQQGTGAAATPPRVNLFREQHGASDPFAQIGQSPAPPPPSSSMGPVPMSTTPAAPSPMLPPSSVSGMPPGSSAPPSSGEGAPSPPWAKATSPKADHGGSANIYRQKGPMRYAQPPSGTYASSPMPGPPVDLSAQAPPQPPFGSGPPTGFAPAPFMPPPTGSSPFPPQGSAPPSHQGPPFGQSSPSYPQAPPTTGFLPPVGGIYHPVRYHWCYMKMVDEREVWYTFSRIDSSKLEEQFQKERQGGASQVVTTDGGRYDVEIGPRMRRAVYWDEEPIQIRRCSWFYKRERDNRYVPYDETQADRLEMEYKNAIERNDWHRRLEFPGNETIVMHNPAVIVHYTASSLPDEWGNVQSDQRPRVVKRGVEDFDSIEDGEMEEVDHLVFIVHGIGEMCDSRPRSIVDAVDEFRSIAHSLIKSHFGPYLQSGHVHRVEFLPIHWSTALHSDATGVDNRMNSITLPSTAKLRHFFNKALMDVLFYTSPAYCQVICDTAGLEMNRLFQIFLARNPTFNGEVSVAGHSLGSSILFDLLGHQHGDGLADNLDGNAGLLPDAQSEDTLLDELAADAEVESVEAQDDAADEVLTLEQLLGKVGLADKAEVFQREQIDLESLSMCSEQDLKDLGLPMGPRKKLQLVLQEEKGKKEQKTLKDLEKKIRKELVKKMKLEKKEQKKTRRDPSQNSSLVEYINGLSGVGQPMVRYPQLEFSPSCLFALGSPIGALLATRGVLTIGEDFHLPTCSRVFNIFHPLDPVAYRLEPMINPSAATVKPVLIPHYKGRKRLHLELKESIARMGTDLKQKIVESLRSTWNSLNEFARAHRTESNTGQSNGDHSGFETEVDKQVDTVMAEMVQNEADRSDTLSVTSSVDDDLPMGQLNEGRRVDYVLQEKPIESFNDYLFALASHMCYWSSEDTALLVLKEIYMPLGIRPIMPGPDGSMPKVTFPPNAGPPPKSVAPYPGAPGQTFPPQTGSPAPPFSQPPSQSPLPPPPMGSASVNQHIQGPMKRVGSPFMAGGQRPGSQASSRGSTPPLNAPPLQQQPPQGPEGMAAPPPMSGFVRSSALH